MTNMWQKKVTTFWILGKEIFFCLNCPHPLLTSIACQIWELIMPSESYQTVTGGDNAQFENGWATVMIVKLSRHIINNFKSYNFVCNIDCPQSNALDKYYTRFFKSDVNFVCKNGRKSEVNLPWCHKLRETLLRTYCMNLLKNISLCSNYRNF